MKNIAAAAIMAGTMLAAGTAADAAGNQPPTTPPTTGGGTGGCNGQPTCGGQTPSEQTPSIDIINKPSFNQSFNPSFNPSYQPNNTNVFSPENNLAASANNDLKFSQSFHSSFKGSAIAPNLAGSFNSDPTGCVTDSAQISVGVYGFSGGLKGGSKINQKMCDAARQERKEESNKASLLGTMGIMATVIDEVGSKPLATTFQAMSVEIPSLGTAIASPDQKVMDLFETKPKVSVAPPATTIGATAQGCGAGESLKRIILPNGKPHEFCGPG